MSCTRSTIVHKLLPVLLLSGVILAGQPGQRGQRGNNAPSPPHDPHDLSGIWLSRAITSGLEDPGAIYTPAGKAAADKNKPSFGPRAVLPALGNDPLGDANPPGIPRALINHPTRIQFIPLQEKVLQLMQWNRVWREIWTDGRGLPEDPDQTWYGYSTGKWEGDEFVVTTSGLDPRAWADAIGTPKSDAAVVEERYHRLNRDNLQLTVTVTDPKFYVKPISGKFMLRLQPNTPEGAFIEDIFAPIDEQSFNNRVRNPAGGVNVRPGAAAQHFPRQVTITAIPGVIATGAKWIEVWHGSDNADGIVGMPDGSVVFAQEQTSTVRKLDTRDMDSAFAKDTLGTGSLSMDSHGRLIGVQRTCTDPGRSNNSAAAPCTESPKVAVIWPEKERKVIADNIDGHNLARPNDLVVGKNGTVYFNGGGTLYVKQEGKAEYIDKNLNTNGIMLSPDEKTLYVTAAGGLTAFDIQDDGKPIKPRPFVTFEGGGNGDGMAVDSEGRLYVTAVNNGGIQVISPQGKVVGTIPTPRNSISAAFAGSDKRTLYIVTGGMLAADGLEFTLPEGSRNNAKTIYKIQMVAQGFKGRAK